MNFSLFIQEFFTNPLAYLIALFILAFGLVLHNVGQAWLANRFGDPSAKQRGFTSTSNPALHLDNFAWIWLAIFGFGIPNAIPVRLYNRQYAKEAIIWLAGPILMIVFAFILVVISLVVFRLVGLSDQLTSVIAGITLGVLQLISLAAMFFFPIPPVAGSRALYAVGSPQIKQLIRQLETFIASTPFSFMAIYLVLSWTGILGFVQAFIYGLMIGGLRLIGLI